MSLNFIKMRIQIYDTCTGKYNFGIIFSKFKIEIYALGDLDKKIFRDKNISQIVKYHSI